MIQHSIIGKKLPKLDGMEMATGRAKYTDYHSGTNTKKRERIRV